MRWLNSLERRFGSLAIPGLIRVIVALNALVYLMLFTKPQFVDVLTLQPDKVRHGELWRLVSYVFIPAVRFDPESALSPLWVFFYLSLLWIMGEGLEQAWGSFKLNLYYLFGMLGTTAAVLLLGSKEVTGVWLNTSLFFAFATLFPNFPMMLFFVIPIRVKWLALLSFAGVVLGFLAGDGAVKAVILVSLANYLLFFGPEWVRQWREEDRTVKRRRQFQIAQKQEVEETLHHCKICGVTEVSAPDKEFRVAVDGEEYCLPHLPSRKLAGVQPPPLPEGAEVKEG